MDSLYKDLPGTLFSVTVPYISTVTDEEIELYGLPMDVINGGRIQRGYTHMADVMLPLYRIIEIYNNGYPITLKKREDVSKIYEILEDYLDKIEQYKRTTVHKPIFDEAALQVIDRFANEIFNLNRGEIVPAAITLQNGFSIGLGSIMGEKRSSNVNPVKEELTTVSRYGRKYKDVRNVSEPLEPIQEVNDGSAYKDYTTSNNTATTIGYCNNNMPLIDLSTVRRKSRYKHNNKE